MNDWERATTKRKALEYDFMAWHGYITSRSVSLQAESFLSVVVVAVVVGLAAAPGTTS